MAKPTTLVAGQISTPVSAAVLTALQLAPRVYALEHAAAVSASIERRRSRGVDGQRVDDSAMRPDACPGLIRRNARLAQTAQDQEQ